MPKARPLAFRFSFWAGIFAVLVSIYGFHLLRSRPGLPRGIDPWDVVRLDQFGIVEPSDLELALAKKTIGERTTLTVRRGSSTETLAIEIVPFYSNVPFPTIYLLIGFLGYLIGYLALGFRWEERRARILYWLALSFSLPLIVSGATYGLRSGWTTYVPMIFFNLGYPLAPALLVHFAYAFSKRRPKLILPPVYGVSLLFGAAFTLLILLSVGRSSMGIFRLYSATFTAFRAYMVALLLLASWTFVLAYREERLQEERAQIKWIFFGLLLGLTPFIFVYQLPKVLGLRPLLTEEFAAVFFAFIPLGFVMSIFRFRFLNVDIVINRSLVYSLLTLVVVGLYLFSLRIFQVIPLKLFAATGAGVSPASALLAAIVFEPARRRIQLLVDKSFYRQSYDYQKAILRFSDGARVLLSPSGLMDLLRSSLLAVLPVDRLEIALSAPGERGSPDREGSSPSERPPRPAEFPPGQVFALREAVSTEEGVDFSRAKALLDSRREIAVPLTFKSMSLEGCLFAGGKKSGQRFSRDDIELLLTLAMTLSLNLERLYLQEEVIRERGVRERLDELNRLKTEFVSTVSHELRTPLTSIQGLTEILEAGRVKDPAARDEILHTLVSESGRLSRLLRNILDFGKIEQQTLVYEFKAEDIGGLLREFVTVFRPQLLEGGFALDLDLPGRPVLLSVDRDAIEQLMINLIDNAMKYSFREKRIGIALLERPDQVEIRVSDRGIGIAPDDQARIFEKFYRGGDAARINPKGVGLGLKIVKHVVEAHRGEIHVESRLPLGTTIRIILPRSVSP